MFKAPTIKVYKRKTNAPIAELAQTKWIYFAQMILKKTTLFLKASTSTYLIFFSLKKLGRMTKLCFKSKKLYIKNSWRQVRIKKTGSVL